MAAERRHPYRWPLRFTDDPIAGDERASRVELDLGDPLAAAERLAEHFGGRRRAQQFVVQIMSALAERVR